MGRAARAAAALFVLVGVFMAFDAAIYAVFVTLILRSPGGTELWMLLLISGLAGSAIMAFYFWGRERLGDAP